MYNNTIKCDCGKIAKTSIMAKVQSFTVADEITNEIGKVYHFCPECWHDFAVWLEGLRGKEIKERRHYAGKRHNKWIGTTIYYLSTITRFD